MFTMSTEVPLKDVLYKSLQEIFNGLISTIQHCYQINTPCEMAISDEKIIAILHPEIVIFDEKTDKSKAVKMFILGFDEKLANFFAVDFDKVKFVDSSKETPVWGDEERKLIVHRMNADTIYRYSMLLEAFELSPVKKELKKLFDIIAYNFFNNTPPKRKIISGNLKSKKNK